MSAAPVTRVQPGQWRMRDGGIDEGNGRLYTRVARPPALQALEAVTVGVDGLIVCSKHRPLAARRQHVILAAP